MIGEELDAILAAIHARLDALELTSLPDPLPEPEPEPSPVPPAETVIITQQPVDRSQIICFEKWTGAGRYERHQHPVILREPTALRFHRVDLAAGGVQIGLDPSSTRILLTGDEQPGPITQSGLWSYVTIDPIGYLGWCELTIETETPGTPVPLWVWCGGEQVDMVAHTGSHDVADTYTAAHIPLSAPVVTKPFPARTLTPFSDVPHRSQMHMAHPVVRRDGYVRRPTVVDGVVATHNYEPYHYHMITEQYPILPMLDGPRGVGNAQWPTHIEPSLSQEDRLCYFTDPWRMGKVSADGTVTTLVGWRHPHPAKNWTEPLGPEGLELVGDWSAVDGPHGLWECWGMAWDPATLVTDPNLQVDGRDGHPHDPVCYLTDTKNNRVLRVTFDRLSHETPARVEVFAEGLADPWDVVFYDDVIYISERTRNAVSAWGLDGQSLGDFVSSPEGGIVIDDLREARLVPGVTLEQARALDCVAPEGLFIRDGWLYVASFAARILKRVSLTNREVFDEWMFSVNNNGRFAKCCVSDGECGPAGTVFLATWGGGGMPIARLPDGTYWQYQGQSPSAGVAGGTGGNWPAMSYESAVGLIPGGILYGGAAEGLCLVSPRQAGDPPVDVALFKQGEAEYRTRGLDVAYGHGGWGWAGEVPAEARTEAIDYYLSVCEI